MVTEARKLHLIEKVLKIKSESKLAAIENFVNQTIKKQGKSKPSIDDFVGILSKEEADEMKKVIAETCEIIDPDAWK